LDEIYLEVVQKHNEKGLTDYVEPRIIDYYSRGYSGFDSDLMLEKLSSRIDWTNIKDVELLSKVELYDESNYGCSYNINRFIVEKSVFNIRVDSM
jgi:hypothetical protein